MGRRMGRSAHVVMASTSPRIKTRHPSSHGIYKSPSRLLRRSPRNNQPSPLLRRSLRISQLRASALEATSALRPRQRRRWNNWITGGSKKGGWYKARIRGEEGPQEKKRYNVAWTGWGRNQEDFWVLSEDVTPQCIEAWQKQQNQPKNSGKRAPPAQSTTSQGILYVDRSPDPGTFFFCCLCAP